MQQPAAAATGRGLFGKPAVRGHGDARVRPVEGRDVVEEVRGEDHELPGDQAQLDRAQGKGRVQALVGRVSIGIGPAARVCQPQHAAVGAGPGLPARRARSTRPTRRPSGGCGSRTSPRAG